MMSNDEYEVISEIHQAINRDGIAKPSLAAENLVSRFSFKYPLNTESSESATNCGVMVDEDGDLIVCRKVDKVQKEGIIAIDIDVGGILELIKANAARNCKLLKANFIVFGLDFFASDWCPNFEAKLTNVTVVLVADVIYDNDVTEAFMNTLQRLLSTPPGKTVYIALEKRYVFTVADLDSVAPCYEYFLQCLQKAQLKPPGSQWQVEQLPIDFPQYFNYERVKELVLWRIVSARNLS